MLAKKLGLDDFLLLKGSDALTELMKTARPSKRKVKKPAGDPRLSINLSGIDDDHRKSQELIKALNDTNKPPHVFQRGRDILRLVPVLTGDDRSQRSIVPEKMAPAILKAHIESRIRPYIITKDPNTGEPAEKSLPVKKDLAEQVLCQETWPFPYLRAVLHSPVFSRNGLAAVTEGYHEAASVYLDLDGFRVPPLPERPTAQDLARAKELIFEDMLVDFPFKDQASRANASALFLLPFTRLLIAGATPLHMVDATEQGTGKGLLVDVATIAATGRQPVVISPPTDEAEWGKQIFSTLRSSPTTISIDNIEKRLDSPSLAAVLTTDSFTKRILGASEDGTVPNLSVWAATGNNVMLSKDIARRTIWIRMNPDMDQPWQRQHFKHSPLRAWVKENRPALVWAGLVLVRNWFLAGRPKGAITLGSFEQWSHVIGGILQAADVDGFLGNSSELYEHADRESSEWRAFVEAWWQQHGAQPVLVASLYRIALEHDLLAAAMGDKGERSQRIRLGIALNKRLERVFGGFRIEPWDGDKHHKVGAYRLVPVEQLRDVAGSLRDVDGKHPASQNGELTLFSPSLRDVAGSSEKSLHTHAHAGAHTRAHQQVVIEKNIPQHPARQPQGDSGTWFYPAGSSSEHPANIPRTHSPL